MKTLMLKSSLIAFAFAIIIPMSVLAQHKSVKVQVHNDGGDSIVSQSIFSTMFEINDLGEMHKKLDSIWATLDKDLKKRINIMAFDSDSLFNDFHFNHHFDFDGDIDSIFSRQKFSVDDKRIDELIKKFQKGSGKKMWLFDEDNLDTASLKNMNVEVITDSVTEGGKTIIKKEIIVKSKDDGSVIIKQNAQEGNKEVLAYSDGKAFETPGKHILIRKGHKAFKPKGVVAEKRVVEEIPISDAELLVKGGVSAKVIAASPLHPKNIEVNVKVSEEYGKKSKTVGMSVTFEDKKGIQVKILDAEGRILFEEVKKKFTVLIKKILR